MSYERGNTTIWAIVGMVIIIAIIVVAAKFSSGPLASTTELPTRTIERGLATSTVTLLEYADLQCPACKAVEPMVETLFAEYGDRVHFVWRHYPLRNLHKNAEAAARASEAAWKQGKFWEMAAKIYEQQENWSKLGNAAEVFAGYAGELGLDVERYDTDVKSGEVKDAVQADLNEGQKMRVPGTPAFFLNGEKVSPRSLEEFRQLLDAALGGVEQGATGQPLDAAVSN